MEELSRACWIVISNKNKNHKVKKGLPGSVAFMAALFM